MAAIRTRSAKWQSSLRPAAEAQRDEILEYFNTLTEQAQLACTGIVVGMQTRYPETADNLDDVYRTSVHLTPAECAIDIRENIPLQIADILRQRAAEYSKAAEVVAALQPLGFVPREDAARLVFDYVYPTTDPVPF